MGHCGGGGGCGGFTYAMSAAAAASTADADIAVRTTGCMLTNDNAGRLQVHVVFQWGFFGVQLARLNSYYFTCSAVVRTECTRDGTGNERCRRRRCFRFLRITC